MDEGRRKLAIGAAAAALVSAAFYLAPSRVSGTEYLDAVVWLAGLVVAGNVGEWWAKRGVKP
jgi:hypothetical protein